MPDAGWTREHGHPIRSPCEPSAQVSLNVTILTFFKKKNSMASEKTVSAND